MKSNQSLYSTLCQIKTLHNAWQLVKTKGASGGIDKLTLVSYAKNLSANLNNLRNLLLSNEYISLPYLQFNFRKNGKVRTIGLPAVQDKIVQQAVKIIIEPLLEVHFVDVSYAYRNGKGTEKAIRRVLHEIKENKNSFVLKADIISFFDSVSHGVLLEQLSKVIADGKIIDLISLWIKNGSVDYKKKWKANSIGIPQGSVISPLLANFFLSGADKYLLAKDATVIRYADDYLFMAKNKNDAENTFFNCANYLRNNLLLEMRNEQAVNVATGYFEFLGIGFRKGLLSISDEKRNKLLANLETKLVFINQRIQKKFFEKLDGIGRYYGKLLPESCLEHFDNALLKLLHKKVDKAYSIKRIKSKGKIESLIIGIGFLSQAFKRGQYKIAKTFAGSISSSKYSKTVKQKINKQKQAFKKFETSGLELTVNTPGTFVGKTRSGIVIRQKGKILKNVPIANLRNINIVAEGVSFSSNLIQFCASNQIAINFFKYNGRPFAKIYSPSFTDTQTAHNQLNAANNTLATSIIIKFIYGKIRNQKNLIKYFSKYSKRNSMVINSFKDTSVQKLSEQENKLKNLNVKNTQNLQSLIFPIEAQAAIAYWSFIRYLISPYIRFPGRHHQNAIDLTNQLLNYGYGILYSRIWEALIKARLDPNIGYLHANSKDRPAFVYDFIEEFRPQAVDRVVVALINKKQGVLKSTINRLEENTRKLIAEKVIGRLNKPEKFRNKEMNLTAIINYQAMQLADFINGNIPTYKPYIAKW